VTRDEQSKVMEKVFEECRALRGAGQKEYAHREDNAFANFERVAERIGISREKVLLVYAEKHFDGIHSYIQGHRSQRESVKGRINDVIVYMTLLRGMVEAGEKCANCEEIPAAPSPTTPYGTACLSRAHAECVAIECGCACHGGHTTTCKCQDCRQRKASA